MKDLEWLFKKIQGIQDSITISITLSSTTMSYVIEPMGINSFLDDKTIKYPRFQRKAVWNKKQNFELCISIFQEYPVGVVILNKEQKVTWLLDGRQRRTALSIMRDNPVELYNWAKSYIKFDGKADEAEVASAYRDVIDKYLEQDVDDKTETGDQETEDDNECLEDEDTDDFNDTLEEGKEEKSFIPERQRKGLQTLLELIMMVHPYSKVRGSAWERLFDFTKYFSKLHYAPAKMGNKVDPIRLRKFLLDLGNSLDHDYDGNWGKQEFIDYYNETFELIPGNKVIKGFERTVEDNWSKIKNSIETIKNVEKIFSDMRIGVVRLSNVSPLDAQNIFSRVNQGGTQLKAEELLSAKPYWNKPVQDIDSKTRDRIHDFYKKMQIPIPEDVVRWDLAATLVDRIEDDGLIFSSPDRAEKKDEIQLDRIAMGFKLLSAMFVHGISNKSVIELETCDQINWDAGLDDLLWDLNIVVENIKEDDFFKYINSYGIPLCKLLGNAPAMEFLTILWLNWKDLGRPKTGKRIRILQRNARLLFDKLAFEYSVRIWRGSSDSKLAKDVSDWKLRLEALPESSWKQLITESCEGTYNGQNIGYANLRPVLVYAMALEEKGDRNRNCTFDVDHIIPQIAFAGNADLQAKKDGLANLCVLPRKENERKGDKSLLQLSSWLGDQLSYFAGIESEDFKRFSSVSAIDDLIEKRKSDFLRIFSEKRRQSLLAQ